MQYSMWGRASLRLGSGNRTKGRSRMPLPGQVQDAASSVPGFDCDAVLSADLARQFFSQGYKFCLRYLSRAQAAQNLTVQEVMDILNSGLALMPVQHARPPGWSPDASLGQADGQEASANAKATGFPSGVSLWCDLANTMKVYGLSRATRTIHMPKTPYFQSRTDPAM